MFSSHSCYLDDSNGASVASRAMLEALSRCGFVVEAFSSTMLELKQESEANAWLIRRGVPNEPEACDSWTIDAGGSRSGSPAHVRMIVRDVPATMHLSPSAEHHVPGASECEEFLNLFEATLHQFRPNVLINYGGDQLAHAIRSRARDRSIVVVFALHNFNYHSLTPFSTTDAVIVPSRLAADHYKQTLGLDCTVLPYLVDNHRALAKDREPTYLTFVNPSPEKGVFPFVRIADELGRRRPDIPILVVESRGSESTLVGCGVDLRPHQNIFLMAPTHDPRDFWRVTRVCLLPSLWWENQPLVAVEAMINGIPVIGSDRGGIPETLGEAGIVLPIPERLTPHTRELPTAEEVAAWVEAIIRLWDEAEFYQEHQRKALAESRRWDADVLEPRYVRFFEEIAGRARR